MSPLMCPFHFYHDDELRKIVARRKGETKLGETIQLFQEGKDSLSAFEGRFVLLGFPESIGVRANHGHGGTETAWEAFLSAFLNLQDTESLPGKLFLLWGHLDFQELENQSAGADFQTLRKLTGKLDEWIYPLIQKIVTAGKLPILIGGGHNNAYPLLKGCSMALGEPVNVVNLDAHSDFRAAEGRHSGNGFRYARDEGFLSRYAMLGLHEGYNGASIIRELKEHSDLLPIFWEDIFIRQKYTWDEAMKQAFLQVQTGRYGLELDMDALENTVSSAATPVGITPIQGMQYCYSGGAHPNVLYLHLPEAAVKRADGLHSPLTGKLLSYLVQSFCKGVLEQETNGI